MTIFKTCDHCGSEVREDVDGCQQCGVAICSKCDGLFCKDHRNYDSQEVKAGDDEEDETYDSQEVEADDDEEGDETLEIFNICSVCGKTLADDEDSDICQDHKDCDDRDELVEDYDD